MSLHSWSVAGLRFDSGSLGTPWVTHVYPQIHLQGTALQWQPVPTVEGTNMGAGAPETSSTLYLPLGWGCVARELGDQTARTASGPVPDFPDPALAWPLPSS